MKLNFTLLFCIFIISINYAQTPSVSISDHHGTKGQIDIDCDYDFQPVGKIALTADYTEIKQSNSYTVDGIPYAPIGAFNEGTVADIQSDKGKDDDTFTAAINLPFDFCFYGNKYSQIIISDNGVVSFNMDLASGECPYAPPTPLPNGLPKNSIFGVFHDMLNAKNVRYREIGTAPNRMFIINYDNLPQYGYNTRSSTSQIVLHETTNIIDVHVKDRYENKGTADPTYRKNAVIGLTNYDSSSGIVAPGRDTGNWEAHNESWRFSPSGSTSTTIVWKKNGSEISGTRNQKTISIQAGGDASYQVEITYNICTPTTIKDEIKVVFSQDFPTVKDVTSKAFCVNNGESYTVDLTQYQSEINPDTSLTFSYFEDVNLNTPISSPKNAYVFSQDKVVYVKVLKSGVCYNVGKINLKLNKKPVVAPNQLFERCDTDNDSKEKINLSALGFKGLGGTYYKFFETEDNAITGTSELNKTDYLLNVAGLPNATKTLYLRVWNSSYNDESCYSIVPFQVKLNKYIKLEKPTDPYSVCDVVEGQQVNGFDLTQYEGDLQIFPTTKIEFTYYTHQSYNDYYKIPNPESATIIMNPKIYIKATAKDYCDTFTEIEIVAKNCGGIGGGGGGPTGPGGPGGGGGAICYSTQTEYTVKLDQDYLRFYLNLDNIEIIGFYDSANDVLLTDTPPYEYTFPVPFFKVIRAKYKIKASGIESSVVFPISASSEGKIVPDTFDVCDVENDGKEKVLLKATNAPYPEWQLLLETAYPDAEIHFFAKEEERDDYANDPNNAANKDKIITQITIEDSTTPIYVYVKYFGCVYKHKINLKLIPIEEKPVGPYIVCDFGDDKVELVNVLKEVNNGDDLKAVLTATQKTKLIEPILYYRTWRDAHFGVANFIPDAELTNYEINASQMSVFARLNIEEQCPIIVEIKFVFDIAVSLPKYQKELKLCDEGNDNQELGVDLSQIIIDPLTTESILSFYSDEDAALTEDDNFKIGGNYDGVTPILYDVTSATSSVVYLRVYDKKTKCVKVLPITIVLIGYPEITNNIIEICDFTDDGKEKVDISVIQAQLIANNGGILLDPPAMTYSFFETEEDAKNGILPSLTTFEATKTNSIWVRIMRSAGDCPMVFELKFNLIQPPKLVEKPLIYTICNNNTGNDNGEIKENIVLDYYKDDVLGFPSTNNYVFTYYDTTEEDAINGENIGKVTSNYTVTVFPTTIWVRVVYAPTGCVSIKPINIEQSPSLENDVIDTDIIQCATGEMSKEVDLTDYPPLMVVAPASLSDFQVSYHTSRQNAVNGLEITSDITKYIVTPASQIWIKFVDNRIGKNCYIIKKLNVTIYSTPKAQDISPEICDETDEKLDDKYIISDLDVYKGNFPGQRPELNIIIGESNLDGLYAFTYYKNEGDAQARNGNTVSNIDYTFTTADLQAPSTIGDPYTHTVYARIDRKDGKGCFSVVSITFRVNEKVPLLKEEIDLFDCDESDNDGFATFDLTKVNDKLSTTAGVDFKYYPTELDAQNGTNEILNPSSWQNQLPNKDNVYVRVALAGYCENIAIINLIVSPYINAKDYTAEICEFNLSGGKTIIQLKDYVSFMTEDIPSDLKNKLDITYHQGGVEIAADLDIDLSIGIHNYLVQFKNRESGCLEERQLTIEKLVAPTINNISPYNVCDDNLDGVFDIDLSSLDALLVTTPADFEITYFSDRNSAWTNDISNLLPKNTNYIIADFTAPIYVRVVDIINNCANVEEIIFSSNTVIELKPAELLICDTVENDGLAEFNLTDATADLLINPITATLTYYLTEADAKLGESTGKIDNYTTYTNAITYEQTVYVRAETTDYCPSVTSLKLVVSPYINAKDYTVEICEFNLSGGKTIIQLKDYVSFMTEDIPSDLKNKLDITYHQGSVEIAADLDIDLSIGTHNYLVQFKNRESGCLEERQLTIEKLVAPTINNISPYNVCDDNLDGVFDIDLSSLDALLVTTPADFEITYFSDRNSAWTNDISNLLPKNTNYIIADFTAPIYVRVVDIINNCANVEEIIFSSNTVIELKPAELLICDTVENDGLAEFNLTDATADLLINPITATLTYYLTEADAKLGESTGKIDNYTTYTNAITYEQTVYVRAETTDYCPSVTSLKLVVSPYINAKDYTVEICEFNLSGGKTIIQLKDYVSFMTEDIPSDLKNKLDITYHQGGVEIAADLDIDLSIGTHNYLVQFKNRESGCLEERQLTIEKLVAPTINNISPYNVCDDDLDGVFDIDLSSLDALLVTTPADFEITYFSDRNSAWTNDISNLLPKNTNYIIADFTAPIYVRVVDKNNNCANVEEIIFSSNTVIELKPAELLICDTVENDGLAEFNLTDATIDLLINPATVTLTYYLTEADAKLGESTGKIDNYTTYTNAITYEQTVYVRAETTDYCPSITSLKLVVSPYINAKDYTVEICEFNLSGGKTIIQLKDYVSFMTEDIPSDLKNKLDITYHQGGVEIAADLDIDLSIGTHNYLVQFKNRESGCLEERQLTIEKLVAPTINNISPYNVCDDDLDGVFDIDLSSLDALLVTTPADFEITYFSDRNSAWTNDISNLLPKNANYIIADFTAPIYVRVVDIINNCANVEEIKFATNNKVPTQTPKLTICDSDNDGYTEFDLTLVEQYFTLPATFIYYKTEADAKKKINSLTNAQATAYINAKAYYDVVYVRVESLGYCPSVSKIELETYYPTNYLHEKAYLCTIDDTVLLDAGPGFESYLWNTGETSQTINVSEAGKYSVTVTPFANTTTNGVSCSATFNVEVSYYNEPVIIEVKVERGNTITVIAKGDKPLMYSLDKIKWQTDNQFRNLHAGIYTIYVKSGATDCEGVSQQTVILEVTNAITPNGDGFNDVWKLCNLEVFGEKSHIQIFDRYGKVLFEQSSNTCFEWDGRYLGRPLPSTDYWYIINIPDNGPVKGMKFSGHITVKNYY